MLLKIFASKAMAYLNMVMLVFALVFFGIHYGSDLDLKLYWSIPFALCYVLSFLQIIINGNFIYQKKLVGIALFCLIAPILISIILVLLDAYQINIMIWTIISSNIIILSTYLYWYLNKTNKIALDHFKLLFLFCYLCEKVFNIVLKSIPNVPLQKLWVNLGIVGFFPLFIGFYLAFFKARMHK